VRDMKSKTFRKKEMLEIGEYTCALLEEGHEEKFFKEIEFLLIAKIPFGKLHPLGEYIGKRGLEKPKLYFDVLDKFFRKDLEYGYRNGIYNTKKMRMSEEEVKIQSLGLESWDNRFGL